VDISVVSRRLDTPLERIRQRPFRILPVLHSPRGKRWFSSRTLRSM
jgi:hypothetical protein